MSDLYRMISYICLIVFNDLINKEKNIQGGVSYLFSSKLQPSQKNKEANPRERIARVTLTKTPLAQYEPKSYPATSLVLISDTTDAAALYALLRRLYFEGLYEQV